MQYLGISNVSVFPHPYESSIRNARERNSNKSGTYSDCRTMASQRDDSFQTEQARVVHLSRGSLGHQGHPNRVGARRRAGGAGGGHEGSGCNSPWFSISEGALY